ncbi:hypothetical protein FBY40_1602 [Microbacterium sp. SLBN-154]|uniref:hypothetical protein n=1 Tax=Microbacterium sp. SLBN-154 TaxID=2768458 RepID=UPI00115145D3|nr:hypothetical protein [Microbacterium sp. SLBN-154]TQK19111.1 hypothetical protein FBY40_1602 [Microbacterium sp. SLBN-154]
MAVLEARFAGGPIVVEQADVCGVAGVTVTMSGPSAGMLPGEARALAAALTAAAHQADAAGTRAGLKRRPDVDELLMSRDV